MVDSFFLAQTKLSNLVTEDEGAFTIIDPFMMGFVLTDLDISVNEIDEATSGSQLIIRILDDRNSVELFDLDTTKIGVFSFRPQGTLKSWRGAKLEVTKNFKGKLNLNATYALVSTPLDYSSWTRGAA